MRRRLIAYLRDTRGSGAAEFALVVPIFFTLVFAVINFAIVLLAFVTLHFSTEAAARCYALSGTNSTLTCTTSGSAFQTYASSRYVGPGISPVFTPSATGQCHKNAGGSYDGHAVTASASITLNFVLVRATIPLSTSACFP